MATYTITNSRGQTVGTIQDAQENTEFGISLIGPNFRNYGKKVADSFYKLLENSAKPTPPSKPVEGQLWWDTSSKIMRFFDGNTFKVITGNTTGTDQPISANSQPGDQWWDTNVNQLKVYAGSDSWVTLGPTYSKNQGESGFSTVTLIDKFGNTRVISYLKVNAEVVAILSKESFTVNGTLYGLESISAGINLVTTITGNVLKGTASNAVAVSGVDSAQIAFKNQSNTFDGNITLAASRFIQVDTDLLIRKESSVNLVKSTGSDLKLTSGDSYLLLGFNGLLTTNVYPTSNESVSTKAYVDAKVSSNTTSLPTSLVPYADNAIDVGTTVNRFKKVWAYTTSAVAADLAEKYTSDYDYKPGTVVVFGGKEEVTTSSNYADTRVAGVVSTTPAYLMNDTSPGVAVALTGKVPCRVYGKIQKGDLLIQSERAGVACAMIAEYFKPGCVIGKALEVHDSIHEGVINIAVGRF